MSDTTMSTYKHPCRCHVKLMSLNSKLSSCVNEFATPALLIVPGTYVLVTWEMSPGVPSARAAPDSHRSCSRPPTACLSRILISSSNAISSSEVHCPLFLV